MAKSRRDVAQEVRSVRTDAGRWCDKTCDYAGPDRMALTRPNQMYKLKHAYIVSTARNVAAAQSPPMMAALAQYHASAIKGHSARRTRTTPNPMAKKGKSHAAGRILSNARLKAGNSPIR